MKKVIFLSFSILMALQTYAQLSGTISVPSGSYPTLTSAINALNTNGVNGATTIEVSASETAPAGGYIINTISGANSSNTVTIKAIGTVTLTAPTGTSTSTDAVIKLVGSDYVTIEGFTIQENVANTAALTWMEWGIALLSASATNGVQFCTIKNCTISLTRAYANNAIYAAPHASGSTTTVIPTSADGAHSENTFISNTITNCLTGIRLLGHNAFPSQNNKIGIGVGTGNTLTVGNNSPTGPAATGIFLGGQQNCEVRNNTLLPPATPLHSNAISGIFMGSSGLDGGNASSYTIADNQITLTTSTVGGRIQAIRTEAVANASITNNTILNCAMASATTGGMDGISVAVSSVVSGSISITDNTIRNNTIGGTTGTTGASFLINLEGSTGTITAQMITITGNRLLNNSITGAATANGAHRLIQSLHNATVSCTISNNIIRNNTFLSVGTVYVINSQNTTGTLTLNNNEIRNIRNNAASGTLEVIRGNTTTNSSVDFTNNIITNSGYPTSSGTTAVSFRGIVNSSNALTINCLNNTIDTLFLRGTNTTANNIIRGIQFESFATTKNITSNNINNIELGVRSSNSSTSCGIRATSGFTTNITRNIVRNIGYTTSGANLGIIAGIGFGYPDDVANISNNFISDIYAKNTSGSSNMQINGLEIASGSAGNKINIYNNSIYLNDAQNTGNGNNLYCSGIKYGNPSNNIPVIEVVNNIVNIDVTPGAAANTVAFRRESGTTGVAPANLSNTTNNNIFYVKDNVTCPSCYVYAEGTLPVLNAFKNDGNFNLGCSSYAAFMFPRETATRLENNISAGSTIGTFVPIGNSYAESGGQNSPLVTTDFAGVTRNSPPDIGALEFSGTAIAATDVTAPLITYNGLSNSICTTPYKLTATITDVAGLNVSAGFAPRLWYKKASENNVLATTNDNTSNGWKFVEATNTTSPFEFEINYNLLNSTIAAGDSIQYFVVAQDINGNVGANRTSFKDGFCPSSVSLGTGAFPLSSNLPTRGFRILATPTSVTTATTKQIVCNGSDVVFSLTSTPNPVGAKYQWEEATSSTGPWSAVAGATDITFTSTLTLTSSTNYRCQITCGTTPIITSTPVQVTILNQMAGAYTLDKNNPASSTNFTTFTDLATALNCGISGPVTVDVVAGQSDFSERFYLNAIPGTSATNTITINGNNNKIKFNSLSLGTTLQFDNPNTVLLNGTDYLTINNLNIASEDISNPPYGIAVHLTNQADNNSFNNCTMTTAKTIANNNGAFGAFCISGSTFGLTTVGNGGNNNTVNNCILEGGSRCVVIIGSSTNLATNNKITNSTIREFRLYGVVGQNTDGTIISGNTLENPTILVTTTTLDAMFFTTTTTGALIEKNIIRRLREQTATSANATNAITFNNADGVIGKENRIYNNLIYDIKGNASTIGINASGADYIKIYHNTVVLDYAAATGTTTTTAGILNTGTVGGMDIRNNNIFIARGGTGNQYGLQYNAYSATTGRISDNNNVYIEPSATRYFGTNDNGTTRLTTLAAWKATNSGAWDQNSYSSNPNFTDPSSGNYKPKNAIINDKGATSLGITTDIIGTPRNVNPDPGAYEFDPGGPDGAIAWVSPNGAQTVGNKPITVRVTNTGGGLITSVDISYQDVQGVIISQLFSGLSIATGDFVDLTFTTPYDLQVSTNITAILGNVNGATETDISNNTVIQSLCVGLQGTYTINNALPTSGTNYSTFTDAVNALNCGIFGPVVFNVVNNNTQYTESIELTPITGASATNTITFNGNGSKIAFSTDATKPNVVVLNGADFINFNNLVFETTTSAATNAFACHLWNNADNNNFKKCTFRVPFTATNSASAASFSISGSSTSATTSGPAGSFNKLDSCTFIGGYVGASISGLFNNNSVGNQVTNSLMQDYLYAGIYVQYQSGMIARNNIIERPTRNTTVSETHGVYLTGTGNLNNIFDKNTIRNLLGGITGTSNTNAHGFTLAASSATLGNENIFTNNVVYNIKNATSNGTHSGFNFLTNTFAKLYYNTIVLDDINATTGAAYGYISNNASTGVEIKNNIFYITKGGNGSKFGIYNNNATLPISDNNDFFINSAGGNNFIGFNLSNQATLTGWQSATNRDANSLNVNPQFVALSTGNLKPTSAALDNKGTPISGITSDIVELVRSTSTPDIGAYEFEPADSDAALTWVAPVMPFAAGNQTISVNVTNVALNTITNLQMSYSDGTTVVNQTFTGLSIPSGQSQVISFATPYNFSSNITIVVTNSHVNGIVDPSPLNSTITQNVCVGMAGTYTINPFGTLSGNNFTNYTQLIQALSCGGVVGPVVIDVNQFSTDFDEQIEIFPIVGASATNTITINGNGTKLKFNVVNNSAGNNLSTLLLTGADYFTFNNLIIEGTVLTVHLWNDADYNTFNNCQISAPAYGPGINQKVTVPISIAATKNDAHSSFVSSGIVSGNDFNKINNCTITGGYNGVSIVGTSNSAKDYNNEISNCTISDFYVRGAYQLFQINPKVNNCIIERPSMSFAFTFEGINATSTENGVFENNIIRSAYGGGNNNVTGSTYGIVASESPTNISTNNKYINNIIYGINSRSLEVYGLSVGSTNDNFIYHNTIVLDDTLTTTSGGGHGIFTYGNSNNIVKNNIVYITRGGTGQNFGLDYGGITGKISENNNVYVNSRTGVNYIGRVNTTNYSSLAAWQLIPFANFDKKSTDFNPNFVSSVDYTPTNAALNNRGVAGLGVTNDIFGTLRKTYPDVGAIEFNTAQVTLRLKAYLESVNAGLMSDYLTTLSTFPVSDPYSVFPLNQNFNHVANGATQTTSPQVLMENDGNGNDIVDWVFVELRTGISGSTTVVHTQAALIQRDGDIVNANNGYSEVEFPNALPGNFYVTLRHRNHLGCRTTNTISMDANTPPIDFTNNSIALNGSFPTTTVGSVQALNSSDANSDGSIDAFDTIIWELENGLFDDYDNNSDYNLDGSVDAFDSITWELNNGKFQELD